MGILSTAVNATKKAAGYDAGGFAGTGASGNWNNGSVVANKSPQQIAASPNTGYDPNVGGVVSSSGNYTPPGSSDFGSSAVPSLAQSPSYAAYLRQLGLAESDAMNDTNFRVNMLNNQLAPTSPQLASINQQGELARKSILGNMESRGILRSGENEQAIAQQRTSQATQLSALQQSIQDQIAVLQHNLAQRLADIGVQRSDQTLNAAGQTFA